MKVRYWRDFNHNYMILEKNELTGEEYMIRMMEQNRIPELLKLQVRKINGKTCLYYEITSRQPITQIYENRKMGSGDIRQLLTGIRDGISRAKQYLLNSQDLLLDPEYIYMDVDSRQVQLCYVPYSGQREDALLNLAEFVLKRLDHGEPQAVELGYELFHQASRENVGFSGLVQTLLRDHFSGKTEEGAFERYPKKDPGRYLERAPREDREKEADKKGEQAGWAEPEEEKKSAGRAWEGDLGRSREMGGGKGRPDGNKKEKEDEKRRRREAGRGKKEQGGRREYRKKKGWVIGSLTAAAALLLFGAVVYFANLDLTQTGGLAFLLLAVVWMAYGTVTGRREPPKKNWIEDDYDEEEEDEFFLNEIFPEGREKKEEEGAEEEADSEGETRCLTEMENGKSFRLVSMEPDQYGDIAVKPERALVGKKKDQVEIWLGEDSVSRLHARLERDQEECFVTDLNSRNGTYVNGERLMPNEKRALRDGDKVSFAARHYRMKIREF